MERIIGIDLGTTNSLAATVFEEGPEVITAAGENPVTPSVLARESGRWIVGTPAQAYRLSAPEQTVFSVKRLMGCDLEELSAEQTELPYALEAAQRKLVKVRIGEERFTPQELSAEILKEVKRRAEIALGEPLHKAVITVPAYFDDAQRQATRDAAQLAGIEAARILNEPTAAAIAYGLDERKDGHVAVYDLGGGTFDISILQLSGKLFKVIATHGDTRLGGDDLDRELTELLRKRVRHQAPEADFSASGTQQRLKKAAEEIKIQLSGSPEVKYVLELPEAGLTHQGTLTREEFEAAIEPWISRTLQSCRKALGDANLAPDQIDEVVLVGGSTIVPAVRKAVAEFFGKPPHVAIDPYKVVAIGAGIQGHLLAGGRRDFLLLDVIPLALGIETLGGTFSKLISANTTIPAQATETFTTNVDHQTAIDINIYQGERELVQDCRNLGRFKLRGIPPMKAGFPLVDVTFRVDANGLLTVSAQEKRSGAEAEIEVIPSHGLTQLEIDQILEASFEHAHEDFNARQLIEFRLSAERVFRGIEQCWSVAEETLGAEERQAIEDQMAVVRKFMEGNDAMALKAQMNALGELTRPLADSAMGRAVLETLQEESASGGH
jgi:Fe-S protein assembly chaperone HscA